jgi:hypothetical protein
MVLRQSDRMDAVGRKTSENDGGTRTPQQVQTYFTATLMLKLLCLECFLNLVFFLAFQFFSDLQI